MRERLTASFVALAVVILIGAGAVRSVALADLMEQQESTHLQHDARLALTLISERRREGQPVTRQFLAQLVAPTTKLVYTPPRGKRPVSAEGSDYQGSGDPERDLSIREVGNDGTVTVSESRDEIQSLLGRDLPSLFTLFSLAALIAGLAGVLAARLLSAPFRKLAEAAEVLGRGRFDLDLPRTRIPEACAISDALRASATQLQMRLREEQAFAEHASHVLRSPLTGLRMELEELTVRDDVPDDVKESAARFIASVDTVSTRAGELVAIARRAGLVEGAAIPLRDLASQLAQRWADRLATRRRKLTASVEGNLDMVCRSGPVEYLLDLVLTDVLATGKGAVRLTFQGEDTHIRISLPAGVIREKGRHGVTPGAAIAEARTVAESIGGRMNGDGITAGIEILVPCG